MTKHSGKEKLSKKVKKITKQIQGPLRAKLTAKVTASKTFKKTKKKVDSTLNSPLGSTIQAAIQTGIDAAAHGKIGNQVSAKYGAAKKIEANITRLGEKISSRFSESAQLAKTVASQTAVQTAHLATETAHIAVERVQTAASSARESLDQVLVNLEHSSGLKFKDSSDMAQKIGRKVLERADEIRAQISKNQYAPQWVKTVSSSLTVPGVKRTSDDTETTFSGGTSAEASHDGARAHDNPAVKAGPAGEAAFDAASDESSDEADGVDIDSPPVKKTRRPATGARSGKAAGATSRSTLK